MTLEKQVCSLELAKKLKELGVPQKSYFYWYHHYCNPKEPEDYGYHLLTNNGKVEVVDNKQSSSAFTVAEFGEILPWHMIIATTPGNKNKDDIINWVCHSESNKYYDKIPPQTGDTEADARAKMLIYLIENELVTLTK